MFSTCNVMGLPLATSSYYAVYIIICCCSTVAAQSNVELHECTERMWAADSNSFESDEYDFNLDGPM